MSVDFGKTASDYAKHGELLARKFPADPLRVPHRVFAVFGRAP